MAPTPWLPMLEANQGAISIVALILALVAFLIEQYRANTQQLRENEREIEDAITLVEDLEEAIEGASITNSYRAHQELSVLAPALRGAAVAHVKKPILSLELMRCAQIADRALSYSADELRRECAELEDDLAEAKTRIEEALIEAKKRILHRRDQERKAYRALKAAVRDANQNPDA
ncbi:MAG: hypothetical protein NT015_18565 [Alphaproteobacteria bacterium]|nr:hypothetical protein [Alphaproteobacteria bacterium]